MIDNSGIALTNNDVVKALEFVARYCKDEYNEIRVDQLLLSTIALIKRQQAEIERLKTENDKLKLDMSYMNKPNTIGDIHEMGAW